MTTKFPRTTTNRSSSIIPPPPSTSAPLPHPFYNSVLIVSLISALGLCCLIAPIAFVCYRLRRRRQSQFRNLGEGSNDNDGNYDDNEHQLDNPLDTTLDNLNEEVFDEHDVDNHDNNDQIRLIPSVSMDIPRNQSISRSLGASIRAKLPIRLRTERIQRLIYGEEADEGVEEAEEETEERGRAGGERDGFPREREEGDSGGDARSEQSEGVMQVVGEEEREGGGGDG